MKRKIIFSIIFIITIGFVFSQSISKSVCYPEYGCFPIPTGHNGAPINAAYRNQQIAFIKYLVEELIAKNNLQNITKNSDGTYSGNFTSHLPNTGRRATTNYLTRNVFTHFTCGNYHTLQYDGVCLNGAENYPECTTCQLGYQLINGMCRYGCSNKATNPPSCTTCASGANMVNGQCVCSNGANNPTNGCNVCPNGLNMINGVCGCSNGAINPTQCNQCPQGTNMVNGQCTCSNGASAISGCTACPAGQSIINGICAIGCTTTNACGQTIQGITQNGKCVISNNINQYGYNDANSSCIQTFHITSSSVYPNGSTEFYWTFPQLPNGIGRRCGFVDLSNPNTPTPIPGLQNLDSNIDRVRIQNIQRTTNFCLVCQFYDIATNRSRGEAAAHNWVRVIRVGEN